MVLFSESRSFHIFLMVIYEFSFLNVTTLTNSVAANRNLTWYPCILFSINITQSVIPIIPTSYGLSSPSNLHACITLTVLVKSTNYDLQYNLLHSLLISTVSTYYPQYYQVPLLSVLPLDWETRVHILINKPFKFCVIEFNIHILSMFDMSYIS
jgi:hypothetical protein